MIKSALRCPPLQPDRADAAFEGETADCLRDNPVYERPAVIVPRTIVRIPSYQRLTMHQPVDGDPYDGRRRGPTRLHRDAITCNINLPDLWISGHADDYECRQVSATFTWTRAHERRTSTVKLPGCFTN